MLKITVVQTNSIHDKAKNIAQARGLIEQAVAADRPDVLVLPEVWNWRGGSTADKLANADDIPGGPAYELLADLARRHKVWIHGGSMIERIPGGSQVYNTTCVFDREGQEKARYRKIHMFDITAPDGTPYNESDTICRGSEVVTYDLEGFKVGCTICYDMRFAELYIELQKRAADIIMVPSSFTLQTGKDHWDLLLRARAVETQCYIVAPGQYGPFVDGKGGTRLSYGHSLIADPWGHIVAKVSDGIGFASANVARAQISRVRELIPMLAHRRLGVSSPG
ncbi:MAG TPA: carbon-nitrogen hydrolase family protein [Hyphomicrobiaceae bacterium]|nr:carbon-nitrogen hydrolase family protein [Hyphomicrobiaceae bacterium]